MSDIILKLEAGVDEVISSQASLPVDREIFHCFGDGYMHVNQFPPAPPIENQSII